MIVTRHAQSDKPDCLTLVRKQLQAIQDAKKDMFCRLAQPRVIIRKGKGSPEIHLNLPLGASVLLGSHETIRFEPAESILTDEQQATLKQMNEMELYLAGIIAGEEAKARTRPNPATPTPYL